MYDKFAQWTYSGGEPGRSLTKDEMLDDITLYRLTNSAISSAQLYWENNADNFNAVDKGVTSRRGKSRSCSASRSGLRSDRCARRRTDGC
jgi:hypothetical protein